MLSRGATIRGLPVHGSNVHACKYISSALTEPDGQVESNGGFPKLWFAVGAAAAHSGGVCIHVLLSVGILLP